MVSFLLSIAVIFVVDSSNRERLDEAQNELVKLVQEKELKEASLLIFANKQVSVCPFSLRKYQAVQSDMKIQVKHK